MSETILVIDNYDSFAYNLVQYVGAVLSGTQSRQTADGNGSKSGSAPPRVAREDRSEPPIELDPAVRPPNPRESVVVRRNDAIDVGWIQDLDPAGIVVSPGPGTPADAGISEAIFDLKYPALGVCLGHQALCSHHGAPVVHAPSVVHGKPSRITHDGRGLFETMPDPMTVGRYHSLAIDREHLPDVLEETAWTVEDNRVVMGVRHCERPHAGVQFHPESILTDGGKRLINAFCAFALEGRS